MQHQLARAIAAGCLLWLVAAPAALAHGPVAREAEAAEGQARLFTSDSATGQVIVVDLPAGEVIARLATPPFILSLGLTQDSRYLFALRGRNTTRDTVTVIDTGADGSGKLRFPAIVRSWQGNAPGGIRDGRLASVGGQDALFNEGLAEAQVFQSHDFGSLNAVPVRTLKLVAPDHYHYQEAGNNLYVGHLAKGLVQIIDRESGEEVGRVEKCPVLHGMSGDEVTGRVLFACVRDVVVIGTRGDEANREVARIPYPGDQRAGVFMHGKDGVIWGTTEGANPAVLRLDTRRQPYAFEAIPVNSAIQRGITEDGSLMLLYSRDGTLDIRDGGTGQSLRSLAVSKPFDAAYHEHVDKALLPDIVTSGKLAYITIPTEGVIVEVDIEAGKVLRRIAVGGQPTRLSLVRAGTTPPATSRSAAAGSP
jgi:DNA-binding beta-propeller fold protein YncE